MFTSLMVWLEFFLPPMMLPGIELTSVHLCLLEGPDFWILYQLSYGSRGDKKVSIFRHFFVSLFRACHQIASKLSDSILTIRWKVNEL